jgi:hypothetical protein
MPDTKLSEIATELTELQQTDRLYAVQYDGSPPTPVSKFVTYETLLAAIGEEVGQGGNVTSTGAFGAEPGSSAAGDLYLPNNASHIARSNGSNFDAQWGPVFPMTPPISGDFAWRNQGGASLVTTSGGIFLKAPTNGSHSFRIREKAAPSTPYTITALIIPFTLNVDYQLVGIGWNDGTKLAVFGVFSSASSGNLLQSSKYATVTGASAGDYAFLLLPQGGPIWLRITDNGTNRICSYSFDGENFIQVHSVSRTDYLTPTNIMFYANDLNTSYECALKLLSWKET